MPELVYITTWPLFAENYAGTSSIHSGRPGSVYRVEPVDGQLYKDPDYPDHITCRICFAVPEARVVEVVKTKVIYDKRTGFTVARLTSWHDDGTMVVHPTEDKYVEQGLFKPEEHGFTDPDIQNNLLALGAVPW